MSMPRMLQQAGPHRREFQPKPPCNRKPPRLTGMQWPEGKNKRSLSSARLRSAPFNPGWIVAVRVLTSTEKPFICDRSSSMPPSRRNEAAQLCPPERMPIFRPRSFASCTAATTSPFVCARTMTSGKRSGLRPFERHCAARARSRYRCARRYRGSCFSARHGVPPHITVTSRKI